MATNVELNTVSQLQNFLKQRGIVINGLNKSELSDLCAKAKEHNLEFDPDGLVEDRDQVLNGKLRDGDTTLSTNPALLVGTSDLADLPNFTVLDIFTYLMTNRFSHGFLREHTKSEGFTLMKDGFVENLEVARFAESDYFALKGRVKPRTRDRDPVSGASVYLPWIVLTTIRTDERSCILSAFCTCKGGIDGCCRHVQALLYEVMDFRDDSKATSVTSGPCMWVRRATGAEKPSLLSEIRMSLHQSPTIVSQRHEDTKPVPDAVLPAAKDLLSGMKKLCPQACQLLTWEKRDEVENIVPALTVQTLQNKRTEFFSAHQCQDCTCDCEELFLRNNPWSNTEIDTCEKETKGQHINENWHMMRYGIITASNVRRILHCRDPDKTAEMLLKKTKMHCEPEAIKFGRESESRALNLFVKAHRYRHRHCTFRQTGLCLSKDFPFMAASPDAIGSCGNKECGDFVVEVKSLYSYRNFHPKVAIKHRNFCYLDNDGHYVLKANSDYYYQIQCQMAVTGVKKGYLVIYTRKGIEPIPVLFNPPFWREQCGKLKDFWKNQVAPKL